MTDRVIDAQGRFGETQRHLSDRASTDDREEMRARRQRREAAELREHLKATVRLSPADRKILARNLGWAIEKRNPKKPTQTASQLFRALYGEEGGASKEKKRKRYIRFDGEPLNDHGPGEEYAARGLDFLRLADGLADLFACDPPSEHGREEMIVSLCAGASFSGASRPRLRQDISLMERFRQALNSMIDRIVQDTDVINYLDEVQNYTIQAIYDQTPETMESLHRRTPSVQRLQHRPNDDQTFSYDRIGHIPRYPWVRLARIYWPRQVLCLPGFVPTSDLERLRSRELTAHELKEALNMCGRYTWCNESDAEFRTRAIRMWRNRQEYDLWRNAIREAGFDPDNMDWHGFEDEFDSTAQNGAEWRTFWEATCIDMHLMPSGNSETLHFEFSFTENNHADCAAFKELMKPGDDDLNDCEIENCTDHFEDEFIVPWFPDGGRSYVCRGFRHRNWDVQEEIEFEGMMPADLWEMRRIEPWPFDADEMWRFLTIKLRDWQSFHSSRQNLFQRVDAPPSLRPLFDAPKKWTPAPDGSLASAILAGLAYGEGDERLDNQFISQVNNLVGCFRDMKAGLAQDFEAALIEKGYGDDLG